MKGFAKPHRMSVVPNSNPGGQSGPSSSSLEISTVVVLIDYPQLIQDSPQVIIDPHPSLLSNPLAVWHISGRDT